MAAVASTGSPLGLPVRSHLAMVTRGVFRMRLTFQDCSWVITTRSSPCGAAQMAVGLGLPSLVNVVNRMYSDLATSANVTGMRSNLLPRVASLSPSSGETPSAGPTTLTLRGGARFPASPTVKHATHDSGE